MNELIKVENKGGKQSVDCKDLYIGLGLDLSNWARWTKSNICTNVFLVKTLIGLNTLSWRTDVANQKQTM